MNQNTTPRSRTPGLIWEFDVFVSWAGATPAALRVTAETPAEARAAFDHHPQAEIVAVTKVRPVLDSARPWLSLAAAAAYLGTSESGVESLMLAGELPRPVNGRPMFHRQWLDDLLEKRMGHQQPSIPQPATIP